MCSIHDNLLVMLCASLVCSVRMFLFCYSEQSGGNVINTHLSVPVRARNTNVSLASASPSVGFQNLESYAAVVTKTNARISLPYWYFCQRLRCSRGTVNAFHKHPIPELPIRYPGRRFESRSLCVSVYNRMCIVLNQ